MVTIIPSYLYSIFAALIVGAIIVSSCSVAMVNIKNKAENQQLANIEEYIAAQSLTLISHVTADGQNVTQFLNLPSQVGNKEYWVRIANNSINTWIESGFGTGVTENQPEVYIPAEVTASGFFISGWGRQFLQCYLVNQTVTLTLNSE